jgi:hypothetical protein
LLFNIRHKKIHYYGEPALDSAVRVQNTTFNTDIGITFGILCSSELLFTDPTQSFKGISDFLVPMGVSGQMPFLTGKK